MKKYLSKLIRNHYKAMFRPISESSFKIGVINKFNGKEEFDLLMSK